MKADPKDRLGTPWLTLWMGAISVRIEVEPRDLWIGAYPPAAGRGLYQSIYICFPLPVFPIHIRWMREIVNWRRPWDPVDRATRSMGGLTRSMNSLRALSGYGETNVNDYAPSGDRAKGGA